eukprot:scaffold39091_cov15-Tisochrysis_lutea.AAC.1
MAFVSAKHAAADVREPAGVPKFQKELLPIRSQHSLLMQDQVKLLRQFSMPQLRVQRDVHASWMHALT